MIGTATHASALPSAVAAPNQRAVPPTSEPELRAEAAALRVIGGRGSGPAMPNAGVAQKPVPGLGGEALTHAERAFFETGFGVDLSSIRIHPVARDDRGLLRLGAVAAAHRGDIWIRDDAAQNTAIRRRLLAHEIAHLMQPPVARGDHIGRSVEDWLTSSPTIRAWSYTQLIAEIDELEAWLERQTKSSNDETRIRQGLAELRAEVARRDRETRSAARARPRPADHGAELPARRPQVLSAPGSHVYTDPAEMRAEYDLIMEWLARRDISRADRRTLEMARNELAPQFATDRARVAGEQRVARLRAALTPSDREAGQDLQVAARTISTITPDESDPGKAWIYANGERIPISSEQATRVRGEINRQLRRASSMITADSDGSWDDYQSMLALNRESPIIGAIAGWLGGAHDPGEELLRRRAALVGELRGFNAEVAAGDMVAASGRLARMEREAQVIHGVAAAFRENHISGAERAVGALEITRDVSFAVAGSIAAVLAAPLVAGAVAGTGATGLGATALTVGGTGVVVGGGEAIVRGGASAGGVLVAGGSLREAGRAFVGEGARGFLDGFMAGAGAGAARVLGPALGIGGQVGNQVLRRMAAEAIVNGTSATVDALIHGASPAQAVQAGLRSAVLALPGAVVGASGNRLVRELGGPLAGGATAYLGAIAAGQSRDEALRAAAVAVTANIVTSRAQHGAEADQRLEARGRAIGESLRPSARAAAPNTSGVTPPVAAAVVAHDQAAAPAPAPVAQANAEGVHSPTPQPGETHPTSSAQSSISQSATAPTVHAAQEATPAQPATAAGADATPQPTAAAAHPDGVHPTAPSAAATGESLDQRFGRELNAEMDLPPQRPDPTGTQREVIAANVATAQAEGLVGPQGQPLAVDAAVQPHGAASDTRRALGVTGRDLQSAHVGASSLLRTVTGYSRRMAETILLPPRQHSAFDQHWMRWVSNRRRAIHAFGSTDFTAPLGDLQRAQLDALAQTPGLTARQRSTAQGLLAREYQTLAADLPDGLETHVPLPAVLGSNF